MSRAFACYGGKIITISSRRQLEGYQVGLRAYHACEQEEGELPADSLDDHEFTRSLDQRMPRDLSGIEATSWRASFIIGWTCAHLMIDAWG